MKKIYINKILAAFIAVALVISVFVLVNRDEKTTAVAWIPTTTPGVDDFGNATTDLVYGQTVKPTFNTTGMQATTYFLYKPAYNCSASGYRYAQKLEWFEQVIRTDTSTPVTLTVTTPGNHYQLSGPIHLDRAGMWVFDTADPSEIDGNDTSSIDSFFWVNTSQDYVIAAIDDFEFGSNTSKTITVTEDGSTPTQSCYIDLIAPDGSTVFHEYDADGVYSYGTYDNITMAGNYTVRAYSDLDLYSSAAYLYYDEGLTEGYDATYGTMFTSTKNNTLITAGDHWNYTICGPWDPPEVNATEVRFRVEPGTPVTSIPAGNRTMYWNFSGEVNISITDTSEDAIASSAYNVEIYNDDDVVVTSYFTWGNGSGKANITKHDGYCHINATNWGVNGSTHYGGNGTWYAYIWVDSNSDRTEGNKAYTEEWNATVEWRVTTAPGAQFKWIDDDAGLSSDNNDGELPYIPAIASVPVSITFQIIGSDHTYYGADSQTEAEENITLSGNALFTGTLDKIPGVSYSGGTWTVPVVPTMSQNGGTITITVTWEGYGSLSETLSIGGSKYLNNGTIVTLTSGNSEFEIDVNQTFTMEVNYANGNPISGASVYLYYIDDGEVASAGDPIQGHILSQDTNGFDGYSLGFNTTQQRTNQSSAGFTYIKAPRNLTIYAVGYVGGSPVYGYARVKMNAASNLKVTFEAVSSPGTSTLLAGYKYSYFYINITTVDAAGNSTGIPDEDDYTQLVLQILDTNGNNVATSIGSLTTSDMAATTMGDDYVYKLSNEYITTPGTYTVYAYNYTHSTEDNNATIYVNQAQVDCDKSPLIWKYDDNISATFTVTGLNPATGLEENLEGTLRIENMSWKSGTDHWYNKTYTNTSDSGNDTIDLDEGEGFVNGQVTVHDITADYLPPGESMMNISFQFKPEDGYWATASGMVPVIVPTVRFDAKDGDEDAKEIKYVRSGLTTDIAAYVTGRGELLPGIFVGLSGQGVSQNTTSGSVSTDKGKVTFSIIPTSTGNITVDVGEEGRTVTRPVIVVTSWDLDLSVNPRINENTAFTVTVVKKGTTTAVEGAAVEIEGIGTVNTDSDGKALFDGDYVAPEVTSDTAYTVTATKDGYASDTATMTIVNIPKLLMSLNPTTAKRGADVVVTVSKDDATPAVNALVTVEGTEYRTGGAGQVTITAPSSDGTYTITASFGTFQDGTATLTVSGEEGAPGFELLTLIIAIGVAFILLRRRRR